MLEDLIIGALKLGTEEEDFISGDDDEMGLYLGAPFVNSFVLTEEQSIFGLANDDVLIGDMLFSKFIAKGEDKSYDRSETVVAAGDTDIVNESKAREFESLIENNDIYIGDDHIFAGPGDDLGSGDVYCCLPTDESYALGYEMEESAQGVVLAAIAGSMAGTLGLSAEAIAGNGETSTAGINGDAHVANFSSFSDNKVYFGDDLIVAGKGDDSFAGDASAFLLAAKGADALSEVNAMSLATAESGGEAIAEIAIALENLAQAEAKANQIKFGDDILLGGKGNDDLVGDNFSTDVISKAGDATTTVNSNVTTNAGDPDPDATAHAVNEVFATSSSESAVPDNWMVFGDDLLKGGWGDDHLTGDSVSMNLAVKAGAAQTTINNESVAVASESGTEATAFSNVETNALATAGMSNNHWIFGDDYLNGGIGSDQMIGDVYDLVHSVKGGDGTSTASNVAKIEDSGGTASAESYITFQSDDTSNVAANALFENNEFIFGDDKFKGGLGPDLMIGDVGTFTFKAKGGERDIEFEEVKTASGSGDLNVQAAADLGIENDAVVVDNEWIFGDDYFHGGHGNDVIIGDVAAFVFEIGDGVDASGNKLVFGNDWINGGKGDDVLIGDTESLSAFAGEDKSSADVYFGYDVFYFEGDFGNDLILDFQVAYDKIDLTAFSYLDLDFDSLMAAAMEDPGGESTWFGVGDHTIHTQGVGIDEFTEDNFMF